MADRNREASHLRCVAEHAQRILPGVFGSGLAAAEQLHGGSGPTIDGIPKNNEEDVRY